MRTIVGMFDRQEDAHAAVKDLIEHDFDPGEVSLLQRQTPNGSEPADSDDASAHVRRATTIGGVTGLLAASSVFFIPGVGPILALGGLVAVLVGGIGGAFIGSLIGALTAWGVSEEDASRYVEHIRMGRTLVAVRCATGRIPDAETALRNHHCANIEYPPESLGESGEFGVPAP